MTSSKRGFRWKGSSSRQSASPIADTDGRDATRLYDIVPREQWKRDFPPVQLGTAPAVISCHAGAFARLRIRVIVLLLACRHHVNARCADQRIDRLANAAARTMQQHALVLSADTKHFASFLCLPTLHLA